MKRTAGAFCVAMALAFSTGISAQQNTTGSTNGPARNDGVTTPGDYDQTSQTRRDRASSDALTLIGCVDRAKDGTYELKNARMAPLGQREATGTTGTTSSATGTTSATSAAHAPMTDTPGTWILKSTTDLAPHVGHQVQITGHASAASTSAGSDTATTTPPTTTATSARIKKPGEEAHSVDVQAVREIARSCS